MTYNIIGSGSSGNATIVFDHILIDCGLPFTRIAAYMKEIQLVLLTHEHSDHFNPSTVRKLHELRPLVRFACCEWMAPHLISSGIKASKIDVLEPDQSYAYGPIWVEPFRLPHDVPNCGWKIYRTGMTPLGKWWDEKLFYATDASSLDGIEAKNFDLYMIEMNYGEAEIQERIARKIEAGEFIYETRALNNHLSEEQALAWLQQNGPNSKFIPMHQHIDKG